MKICYLAAGTGSFHCGQTIRDEALVAGLRAAGHRVRLVPLYLPLVSDDGGQVDAPLFLGGINMFLQQHSPLHRHTPRFLDAPLDAAALLRASSGVADMTRVRGMGPMTGSMLAGRRGRQRKELDRLLDWLEREVDAEVAVCSSVMLSFLVAPIRARLRIPVVCHVGGEEGYLDGLGEEWSRRCWDLIRGHCRSAAALLAPSDFAARTMGDRLGIDPASIDRCAPGVDREVYVPAETPPGPPTIGFFAHCNPIKGLHLVVDAFRELARRDAGRDLRLLIGGACNFADRRYLRAQVRKLRADVLADRVEVHLDCDRAAKVSLLRRCTVLSVPATYPEAFGLYTVEALACGVPLILPARGALPEIVEATGGGRCYPVENPENEDRDEAGKLAAALAAALAEPEVLRRQGARGRAAVLASFTRDRMVADATAVLERVLARKEDEAMSDAIVKLEGVTKTYGGHGDVPAQTVLDGIDLEIARGSATAIVGPSGCGKSTLLNLIGALDSPTAGRLDVCGEDPAALDGDDLAGFRNRRIGFIFQDHHLLPQCTVRENVLLPALAHGRPDEATAKRADSLLERVGLGDRGNDWPTLLSGGERQRVAVVRALVNEPDLLLADEPTGALDQKTSGELGDLLLELQRELGTTLLVVTHEANLARRMQRTLRLREGSFEEAGEAEGVGA